MKAYATSSGQARSRRSGRLQLAMGSPSVAGSSEPRPGGVRGSAGSTRPLRYAVAVNSVSSIMLNKIDILSAWTRVLICMAYEVDGKRVEWWALGRGRPGAAKPIYERFPGWTEPIHAAARWRNCRRTRGGTWTPVERTLRAPIALVSVGPERHETIERMARQQRPRRLPDRRRFPRLPPAPPPPTDEFAGPDPARRSLAPPGCWCSAARPRACPGVEPHARGGGRGGHRGARKRRHRRGAQGSVRAGRFRHGPRGGPGTGHRRRRGSGRGRSGGAAGRRSRGLSWRKPACPPSGRFARRADRVEQGILPRGRRGGRVPDGPRRKPSGPSSRPSPMPASWRRAWGARCGGQGRRA